MRLVGPLALAAAAIAFLACGVAREEAPAGPVPADEAAEEIAPVEGAPAEEAVPPVIPRIAVVLYFPSAFGDVLVPETREIFETREPGDRAKQILSDLIAGPASAAAVRAVPEGTTIRQVYVTPDGVAWIDLTSEVRDGLGGGSSDEMMTVYAIVDSIALNIPEIGKVGLLVEGRPVDTLNGHIDLRRPLPARRDLVRGRDADEGTDETPSPSEAPREDVSIRPSGGGAHA